MRIPVLYRAGSLLLFVIFSYGNRSAWADEVVTRIYQLKNADVSNVIQVVNFSIADPTKRRILAGQGKRLVVTDAPAQQDDIAELLPIVDITSSQTDPRRVQMEMLVQASRYLQQKKKSTQTAAQNPAPAAAAPTSSPAGKTGSYDTFTPAHPYKSVYSEEDAKITHAARMIRDESSLLSLSSLTLKGIFMSNTKSPLALLSFESVNYIARDGGLFESNRTRVQGVVSQVRKNSVILTGADRIPREIKFKSTL